MIISRSVLRMKNVSDKRCRENKNTHVLCSVNVSENYVVYEIICKNIAEPVRPQLSYGAQGNAQTHSEYIILNDFHSNNGCIKAPQI
jgi:hypothetical protein